MQGKIKNLVVKEKMSKNLIISECLVVFYFQATDLKKNYL